MAGHICEECYNHPDYGGCCSRSFGGVSLPLTPGDAARIAAATGLPQESFLDPVALQPEELELLAMIGEPMGWLIQQTGGELRKLAINPYTQECIFLKNGVGCTLGELRPSICKLFPFFPTQSKDGSGSVELKLQMGGSCLAAHRAEMNQEKTISLLAQTPEGLKAAVEAFLKDIVGY